VICPQAPSVDYWPYPLSYTFERSFHIGTPTGRPSSWYVAAVLDLIASIQQTGFHFYNEANLSGEDLVVPDCNINTNKIYCMGASLGGHACWGLARKGRDVFAAMINTSTFCIGSIPAGGKDYYRVTGPGYDYEKYLRLYRELDRIWHIPQFLICGTSDYMYKGMQGIFQVITDYFTDKFYDPVFGLQEWADYLKFISISGMSHGDINVINYIFNPTKKFILQTLTEQQYSSESLTNPMDWLFSWSKYSPTPEDPYPLEEETYYPERDYCVISNNTSANSIYTGQRLTIDCDKTKDVKVRIGGVDTDVTFTNGYYEHIQSGYNCFRLWDRGIPGFVDKLSSSREGMLIL
jgi:hypothetical protein